MYELSRRRCQLWSIRGPEFDDLPQQAADDALIKVLDRLDEFAGLSRFTTVDTLRGTISFTSPAGAGTTIRVKLPASVRGAEDPARA